MKQFLNLSDKHKERAIHFAQHIVIDNLIEDGITLASDASDDIKERFEKITELLNEAKTMEDPMDQSDFLLENELTSQIIFEEAYELASTSLYIEKDEVAFDLREIDSHYVDEDLSDVIAENEEATEETINGVVSSKSKKDMSQLN